MNNPVVVNKDQSILCERKPFAAVLFSAYGITMLVLSLISFGVTFLVLVTAHFGSPSRLWVTKGRLCSSKMLPSEGVDLRAIRLEVVRQTVLFVPVNRYIKILYVANNNKQAFLGLNEIYYGKCQIDRAIEVLAKRI